MAFFFTVLAFFFTTTLGNLALVAAVLAPIAVWGAKVVADFKAHEARIAPTRERLARQATKRQAYATRVYATYGERTTHSL